MKNATIISFTASLNWIPNIVDVLNVAEERLSWALKRPFEMRPRPKQVKWSFYIAVRFVWPKKLRLFRFRKLVRIATEEEAAAEGAAEASVVVVRVVADREVVGKFNEQYFYS